MIVVLRPLLNQRIETWTLHTFLMNVGVNMKMKKEEETQEDSLDEDEQGNETSADRYKCGQNARRRVGK